MIPPTAKTKSDAGASIVEVLIVCALLGALALVITQSTTALSSTQKYHRTQMSIIEGADQLIREIEWDARFATKVFVDSTSSNEYRAALDVDTSKLLTGSRLPKLTTRGYFKKDTTGNQETGNLLFLARTGDPKEIKLPDTVGGGIVRIDIRFFVFYYIESGKGDLLDVVRWASAPMADYSNINSITDPARRQSLLGYLYDEGVTYVWNPDKDRNQGLHQISSSGVMTLLLPGKKISKDDYQTRPSLLVARKLQVAKNGQYGGVTVPDLATALPGNPFPAGLEIQVDGPATGKLLKVRLVAKPISAASGQNITEAAHVFSCGGT